MKEWDKVFLLGLEYNWKDKISFEEYERELAVPEFRHRRLTDIFNHNFSDLRLISLFGQTLSRLEEKVFLELLEIPNLFFHNAAFFGEVRAFRLRKYPDQPLIQATFSKLDSLHDSCVVGVFAHELAHIYLRHGERTDDRSSRDVEAECNELVRKWGFGFELERVREFFKSSNVR